MFQEANVPRNELRARTAKVLLQRLYREISTLIAEEVDLAKAEATHGGGITAAAKSFAFSAACGILALASLAACAIAALAIVLSLWLSALLVGVLFGIAALALRASAQQAFARATKPLLAKLNSFFAPVDSHRTLAERQARVDWTRKQVAQTMAALEQKTDLLPPLRDTALGLGSLGVAVNAIIRSGNDNHH